MAEAANPESGRESTSSNAMCRVSDLSLCWTRSQRGRRPPQGSWPGFQPNNVCGNAAFRRSFPTPGPAEPSAKSSVSTAGGVARSSLSLVTRVTDEGRSSRKNDHNLRSPARGRHQRPDLTERPLPSRYPSSRREKASSTGRGDTLETRLSAPAGPARAGKRHLSRGDHRSPLVDNPYCRRVFSGESSGAVRISTHQALLGTCASGSLPPRDAVPSPLRSQSSCVAERDAVLLAGDESPSRASAEIALEAGKGCWRSAQRFWGEGRGLIAVLRDVPGATPGRASLPRPTPRS
jgi:hypothetical protein